MSIALLATGDEIIQGDTINTNAAFIAQSLNAHGLPVGWQMACPDDEPSIVNCLQILSKDHSMVIVIGGLGPTSDDKTRFALANFLGVEVVVHEDALAHIMHLIDAVGLTMTAGERQQALFPPAAQCLPNPQGTAMGCVVTDSFSRQFVLLPGPPRECLPMFEHFILPLLQETQPVTTRLLKWRLFGLAESQVVELLEPALADMDCVIGYRLETPYVEFKVRCDLDLVSKINQTVDPLVAKYLIATPEYRASEQLARTIEILKKTIVIQDEVTGGVLQTLIQHPKTRPWLQFNPTNHQSADAFFHLKGLDLFWEGGVANGHGLISVEYRCFGNQGTLSYSVPWYSSSVIHFAAEWFSYSLNQLLDHSPSMVV